MEAQGEHLEEAQGLRREQARGALGQPLPGAAADALPSTGHAQQTPATTARPETPLPVWQSAFAMAPNVRFTRTPEAAIQKRRAPEVPATPVSEAVATPVKSALPPHHISRPPPLILKKAQPPVVQQPQEAPLPLSSPADMPAPEALPADAEISLPTPGTSPVAPLSIDTAPHQAPAASGFSLAVSDHVFFETMGLDVDLDALSPLMRKPVPKFTAPPPQSVVALYREVLTRHFVTMPRMADAPTPDVQPVPEPEPEYAPPAAIAQAPEDTGPAPAEAEMPVTVTPEPTVAAPVEASLEPEPLRLLTAHWMPVPQTAAFLACADLVEPMVATHVLADAPVTIEHEPQAVILQPCEIQAITAPVAIIPDDVVDVPSHPVVETPVRTMEPAEDGYEFPPVVLLQRPLGQRGEAMSPEALQQSAGRLESILEDFGIKGEIIDVCPGPVVTLYEFEPAPGVKSSRVIGLSEDIARSMSALSARVAVVPGRNVIGIELPNAVRETVYFRELIESEDYWETRFKLALCLGKTIGGEPVIAELAKMPHLLVAGTTGSGKSVAINTMILSLLYRLKPEECRLIMIDPKMLELSIYDGIPHLLTPVVTDPKKAVMALKWAVREMEDRYRKMSRLGVRNIDGYNARAALARAKGETILCSVQTGFDRHSGEPIFEQEEMDLTPMPYIVVIVDEMADLMMVAGKEIEGAIQRLAQMARAAGIHLIMATQRPSVDVITGTIKANFPTRISFQVTSKIDSRTILGEQGAEHLLGQGDMLHMAGGGRISRVHGPFVSDEEVEKIVAHLKTQGRPEYLGTVTEEADEAESADDDDAAVFDKSAMGGDDDADGLYEKAVKVVMRDKKCSTSYIQRRLQIGYNRAASLVERMEQEGLVGAANHVGKREIIAGARDAAPQAPAPFYDAE